MRDNRTELAVNARRREFADRYIFLRRRPQRERSGPEGFQVSEKSRAGRFVSARDFFLVTTWLCSAIHIYYYTYDLRCIRYILLVNIVFSATLKRRCSFNRGFCSFSARRNARERNPNVMKRLRDICACIKCVKKICFNVFEPLADSGGQDPLVV